jgi:hypothetical protein
MKVDNSELREALSKITKQDVEKHHALLMQLKNQIPHQISETYGEIPGNLLGDNFNCFEFAFDLILSVEYKACLDYQQGWKIRPVGCCSDFAKYLMDNLILKECAETGNKPNIIVYFGPNGPTHAGKLETSIVTSKWGSGLILQHAIYEVPSTYGNEARQYQELNIEDCIDAFIEFAKENGIPYED